ncbi:MAG TPA: caspase family protein [Thermoanaerobaculia bacterium]
MLLMAAAAERAAHPTQKRALLVGINDYSASTLPVQSDAPDRGWPSLLGAVNDVTTLRELLLARDFEVVSLTDQQATRRAIVGQLERLARTVRRGDVVFFYFAGHGSQVRNSRSDEADGLDESLVPADSRRGGADIRDKELRRLFNRILDHGAKLTVMIDSCHSGSGARGRTRAIARDERDVADAAPYGPYPEDRGALVIAAAQDYDRAGEVPDADGKMRGAFTWAWLRALRDAQPNEAAVETFLRAQARLRGETPLQEPVLAGNDTARQTPFLGERPAARRSVVAVEQVQRDGTVVLQGGWANGLVPGDDVQGVRVTKLLGPGRSEGIREADAPRAGELLETESRRWYEAEAPSSGCRLEVRRGGKPVQVLYGGQSYELFLHGNPERFVYVFATDSSGHSTLLFPERGSVENRHVAPKLCDFTVAPPYGNDTFYLLTTDEPLPNPWVLQWDGVRAPFAASWSLDKFVYETRHKATRAVSKQ